MFVLGILIAGAANATSRKLIAEYGADHSTSAFLPLVSTMMFCFNLSMYLFLLLFWVRSVQRRLLPSKERVYLITAAICAVIMLLLRSIKYRLVSDIDLDAQRYIWYLYYVPMILLPTLFLMTCLRINKKNTEKRFDERLLLIPAIVLISLFLTNDLHYLAFRPNGDSVMSGANASYFNNGLFYVYYGYYGVTITLGLALLVRANRRLHSVKRALLPFAFLFIMLALVLIDKTLNWIRVPSMFNMPEVVSFSMVGLFESCIRNRLIPYNENYAGFFVQMSFPAVITDKDLVVSYRSAQDVSAGSGLLRKSLDGPLYLDEDTKLSARPVTEGYAFYTEDESELNRLNEKLADANELISEENDLISAENELRAKQAQVDSRNLIYARIAEKMLPYHRLALEKIDGIKPDDPDFDKKIACLNLLNAYIKRGTNLLLVSEGEDEISVNELKLAVDELARYLHYCGVRTNTAAVGGKVSRDDALSLFTSVYAVVGALPDNTTLLNIAINGGDLRIAADGDSADGLPGNITVRESGGIFIYGCTAGEGGAV